MMKIVKVYEQKPMDSRKSFYGKAKVQELDGRKRRGGRRQSLVGSAGSGQRIKRRRENSRRRFFVLEWLANLIFHL